MDSKVRVRTGRILLITVGTTLLLNAFHVIELPWAFLWPVLIALGGIAMIRWVTKPEQDEPLVRRPQPEPPHQNLALRVARMLIGIFVKL